MINTFLLVMLDLLAYLVEACIDLLLGVMLFFELFIQTHLVRNPWKTESQFQIRRGQ